MSKSNDNPREYNFCGICYEEHWQGLQQYLDNYLDRGSIRCYHKILHEPDEEDKQQHVHFIIEFWNAHSLTAVNKQIEKFCSYWRFGLLEYCSDIREYSRYILHRNEIHKKTYNVTDVYSSDKERFIFIVNSENSNQISSDKVFLNKGFELIKKDYKKGFTYIIDKLTFDKQFKASQVKKYSNLLWRYYDEYVKEMYENKRWGVDV